jgi:hypothetical protein
MRSTDKFGKGKEKFLKGGSRFIPPSTAPKFFIGRRKNKGQEQLIEWIHGWERIKSSACEETLTHSGSHYNTQF